MYAPCTNRVVWGMGPAQARPAWYYGMCGVTAAAAATATAAATAGVGGFRNVRRPVYESSRTPWQA